MQLVVFPKITAARILLNVSHCQSIQIHTGHGIKSINALHSRICMNFFLLDLGINHISSFPKKMWKLYYDILAVNFYLRM